MEIMKTCPKCGSNFKLEIVEGSRKKERKYCSRSCSNSRIISEEQKKVVSEKLKQNLKPNVTCVNCGEGFYRKPSKIKKAKYCSKSCSTTYRNKFKGLARSGGLKSVETQSNIRRSKNEIHFSNLCQEKFNKVLTNEPIFNGWDADVIIEDIKVAVLWNGRWHYEKITESHSVEQVQNRDKIKIKEIQNKGYKPYVIKDMGGENKLFVKEKFLEFLDTQGIS